MKQIAVIACLSLALLQRSNAAEPANPQDQQMAALIKEIQAQQAVIAANHAKIEAKLTAIAEVVRVARIFSSRGGN